MTDHRTGTTVHDVKPSPPVTTASEWRRFIAVVLAVGAAVALSIVAHSSSGPTPGAEGRVTATYGYSCCSAALVDTVYHPGEVMAIHWTRVVLPPAMYGHGVLLLSARLVGPFASVEELKATITSSPSSRQAVNVASSVTRVRNTVAANPVTRVAIPSTAAAGYYNLTVTMGSSPRNIVTGAGTIVRVAR